MDKRRGQLVIFAGRSQWFWVSFCALTILVGRPEGHLTHKNPCHLFPVVLFWNKWWKNGTCSLGFIWKLAIKTDLWVAIESTYCLHKILLHRWHLDLGCTECRSITIQPKKNKGPKYFGKRPHCHPVTFCECEWIYPILASIFSHPPPKWNLDRFSCFLHNLPVCQRHGQTPRPCYVWHL